MQNRRAASAARVLVTGAAGMLGQAVVRSMQQFGSVVPLTRADVDLTDAAATIAAITHAAPTVVVHCAAWTDVDACETDADRAFRENGLAARNVAIAAQRLDAAMCFISTDYVFDGRKPTAYREYDPPAPLGVYGRSKRWGEEVVQALVRQHWIVRTSWLFGPGGGNFVQTMYGLLRERAAVQVVDDQRGSPTFTAHLAEALTELVQTPFYGTYHLSNSGNCTWFDLAQRIAARIGSSCKLTPCTTLQFPRPAPRPANSILDDFAWRAAGFAALPAWQDGLDAYVQALQSSSQTAAG
jgi:dTDP-4-dehydrorhamnose reductase